MRVVPSEERKVSLTRTAPRSSHIMSQASSRGRYQRYEAPGSVPFFYRLFRLKRKVSPTPAHQIADPLAESSRANSQQQSKSTIPIPLDITFQHAFGVLGIPLLVVVVVCIVWTSLLIVITVAPNEAANILMNTSDFDNGNFWLIVERVPFIKWSSVAGLVLLTVCYFVVLVRLLRFRHAVAVICRTKRNSAVWSILAGWWMVQCSSGMKGRLLSIQTFYLNLTGFNGTNRKFFNAFMKTSDLIMQGLVLRRSLNQGLPNKLVYGYASFMCLNGLSVTLNILTGRNSAFAEILIDSLFDLAAAVLYPIAVLGYCIYTFTFDRGVYLVNAEMLPEGNFERYARMQADPAEVALFLINFNSLRISSALDFALTIGMNLSFCYRYHRAITALIAQRCRVPSFRRLSTVQLSDPTKAKQQQRQVPRWVALLFLATSSFIVVFTHMAVTRSRTACGAYPECVAFAYNWKTDNQCPCITMIDGDRAPRTAQDWDFPEDVTEKVRALASAGLMQGLQLINRQLLRWPEELRRCTSLQMISLIYTSTEEIPSWTKEFKGLQHLHVEGKDGCQNLVTLPPDLFSDLPDFTFLHLGNHHKLKALPAFDGTPNLRSIVFAVLISLTELPSFGHLTNLETLALAHNQQVPSVPDMTPLVSLSRFTVFRPNNLCCNGFIGACDVSDSFCQPDPAYNVPAALCLAPDDPRHPSPGTIAIFEKFSFAICQKPAVPFAVEKLSDFPTPERIASCAGVMYRECEIPGVTSLNGTRGMCYSSRMQVVACNVDPLFIEVRRVGIERGIGPPCDPQEEAWLGCKVHKTVKRYLDHYRSGGWMEYEFA